MFKTRVMWPNYRYQYVEDSAEAISMGAVVVGRRWFADATQVEAPPVQASDSTGDEDEAQLPAQTGDEPGASPKKTRGRPRTK